MATFTIEESDKFLNAIAVTMREASMRGLQSAALRTVNHIVTVTIPAIIPEPTSRGIYKAAWHVEPLPNGYMVVNSLAHAIFIEYGVRAENVKIGRKLIESLTEWVRAKNIGATVTTTKSGLRKVKKATVEEATSIAWAIAKTMKKRGIFNNGQGWHVLGEATKNAPRFIREEVARELKREFGL